jgi:hypothetical protein
LSQSYEALQKISNDVFYFVFIWPEWWLIEFGNDLLIVK